MTLKFWKNPFTNPTTVLVSQFPDHTTVDEKHIPLILSLFTDIGPLQRDWWWLSSSTREGKPDSQVLLRLTERGTPWSTCYHVPLEERVTCKRGLFFSENTLRDNSGALLHLSIFQKTKITVLEERREQRGFFALLLFCFNFSLT